MVGTKLAVQVMRYEKIKLFRNPKKMLKQPF